MTDVQILQLLQLWTNINGTIWAIGFYLIAQGIVDYLKRMK